jgi:hypothetical protein
LHEGIEWLTGQIKDQLETKIKKWTFCFGNSGSEKENFCLFLVTKIMQIELHFVLSVKQFVQSIEENE